MEVWRGALLNPCNKKEQPWLLPLLSWMYKLLTSLKWVPSIHLAPSVTSHKLAFLNLSSVSLKTSLNCCSLLIWNRRWLNWEKETSLRKPLDTWTEFYRVPHLNISYFKIRNSLWLVFGFASGFPYQNTANIFLLIWSKRTKSEIINDFHCDTFEIPLKMLSFELTVL